jgi:hypothetical protein
MIDFRWVDMVHTRMLVRYGAKWIAQIAPVVAVEGGAAMLKADWGNELHGIGPDALKHALEHLPADFPPTAGQFRALCVNAPKYAAQKIEGPSADPGRVADAIAGMRSVQRSSKPLQWAYTLQAREVAGERLSPGQRACWRAALAEHPAETTIAGDFTPIPSQTLPPGMRIAQSEPPQ